MGWGDKGARCGRARQGPAGPAVAPTLCEGVGRPRQGHCRRLHLRSLDGTAAPCPPFPRAAGGSWAAAPWSPPPHGESRAGPRWASTAPHNDQGAGGRVPCTSRPRVPSFLVNSSTCLSDAQQQEPFSSFTLAHAIYDAEPGTGPLLPMHGVLPH